MLIEDYRLLRLLRPGMTAAMAADRRVVTQCIGVVALVGGEALDGVEP